MKPGSQTSKRGLTIPEVAIYSTILLILLGGVVFVVEGGARYFRLAQAHETVNRQAVLGLSKMRRELVNASQSSTIISTTPQPHILFLSPFEMAPSTSEEYTYSGTTLEYKKWVCFYRNSDNQLVMTEFAPPSPPVTDPGAEPPPDFATDILPALARPLANNVSRVEFTSPSSAVYELTIETEEQTASDRSTKLELISSVRLINS